MDDDRSDALVLFGATGDLARRKLFPSIYRLAARGSLRVPIIGVARSPLSDADLVSRARAALTGAVGSAIDAGHFDELTGRLSYVSGDYADPSLYDRLAERRPPPGDPSSTSRSTPTSFLRWSVDWLGWGSTAAPGSCSKSRSDETRTRPVP